MHRQVCFEQKPIANRISVKNSLLENVDFPDMGGWATSQEWVTNASEWQNCLETLLGT